MKYAKIGGQAVIEGIMMRCGDDYAVAVRTPDRHIEIKKEQYRGLVSRFKMRRVPIIRGVLKRKQKKAVMEPRRSTPGFRRKKKALETKC